MLTRRTILAAGLAATFAPRMAVASSMTATVAMTFDTDVTTYPNAFFDMQPKGIPGTFFADSSRVGQPGQPIRDNLVLMAGCGWEIGARVYGTLNGAEANMVSVWNNNRDIALDRLKAQRDEMLALGFAIKSIAASQRAWSPQLRGLASHLFEYVRVADVTAWGSYPISDPLYVQKGGTASWSASDTVASLCAQLDAVIAVNGIWFPVIHRVDTSGDPLYTISPAVFQGFTAYLQSKIAAGAVRALTFRDAIQFGSA